MTDDDLEVGCCARCETGATPLSLPDGQPVCWYCGDCHGITTDGRFVRLPQTLPGVVMDDETKCPHCGGRTGKNSHCLACRYVGEASRWGWGQSGPTRLQPSRGLETVGGETYRCEPCWKLSRLVGEIVVPGGTHTAVKCPWCSGPMEVVE